MITISEIKKTELENSTRIETVLLIESDNKIEKFPLYVETQKEWGGYLVTDRCDAFVVGILMYAMGNKHDIKCMLPISSELKFMLERNLIFTLCKNDSRYYRTRILADVTDDYLKNEGAVGTGISLGLDSFCTIAEHYNCKSKNLRLTHLITLQDGVLGGYYQENNWDYCAAKLYEREQKVAQELGLVLIVANSNLNRLVKMRADYYVTYWIAMIVMSLGHLFKIYFISSLGVGYANFNISKRFNADCEYYDLLSLGSFSLQGGVRFISGGGAFDRLDKMRIISQFSVARKNLQSCLLEYFNCMHCTKCRRNLVTIDALGLLDEFSEVYDIEYYRRNRDEYIDWMCKQVNGGGHDEKHLRSAYELIKKREPEYIKKFELTPQRFIDNYIEIRRQRNVFRDYSKMLKNFICKPNSVQRLRQWFEGNNIKKIVIYGHQSPDVTQFMLDLKDDLGLQVVCIVGKVNVRSEQVPVLPANRVAYPDCDAVIICRIGKSKEIKRRLSEFMSVPVLEMHEILGI